MSTVNNSKSISKIQSQNENNDNRSEKSLNFFINPSMN